MPETYEIRRGGKVFQITGDHPPTEAELDRIFNKLYGAEAGKPTEEVSGFKWFLEKTFVQPFNSAMVGYFRGSASITQTLDSYAKWLEENVNIPGMDRGALFEDLTKLYNARAEHWKQNGIPEGEGLASDITRALYEGAGQFGVELPAIIALGQWGLPIYSAIKGGGEAAEEGESIVKGMAIGGLEGTAMHFTLKGVRMLPRVYGEAAGGAVFGSLTLQQELQKPDEDVDWSNVVAQTLLGIGLTMQGRRIPTEEFINNLRSTYNDGKPSFLKFAKSRNISDKNAVKLYEKLQENESEISPELRTEFKEQIDMFPEDKVAKTVEPEAPVEPRIVEPKAVSSSRQSKEEMEKIVGDKMSSKEIDALLEPDVWVGLEEGNPTTVSVYHGAGKRTQYAEGAEGAALGKGRYSAIKEKDAEVYGDVERLTIELNKPVVIEADADLVKWFGEAIPSENVNRISLLKKARSRMESEGHDGVIISIPQMVDVDVSGRSIKRLREIFDVSQTIEFKPAKGIESREPIVEPPAKPGVEPEVPVPPEPGEVPLKTTPITKETVEKLRSAADKVETAETDLPKYARAINLERQEIPEALKRMEVELAKLEPKKIQGWDETGELSKEILSDHKKTQEVVKKARGKQGLTAAEMLAIRQINVNGVNRLHEIIETGAPENVVTDVWDYYNNIFKVTSDASSESGRALNIHKKDLSEGRIAKSFSELGRKMNEREMEEFKNLDMENPEAVQRFISRLGDPKPRDYFYEYWYNSILSGIPTHLVNVMSNTAWGLFQVPHRALVGGVDKMVVKLTGKPRQRYLNETLPLLAGYRRGFGKGAQRAWETVKTGEPPIPIDTKWSIEMGRAVAAFQRSPYKIMRTLSPYVSSPTRALRAMDVWANSIAYDGQINALARRSGQNRGLEGNDLKNFEKEFVKDPPKKAHRDAMEFAKYATFMSDPGKFTQVIMRGRKTIPGARLIVPFVNTIANLTKRGLEHTPFLGLVRGKDYYKSQPAAEIIAKQIEGSILALYIMSKAAQGDIIGSAPEEKTQREAFYRQGKKAWSMRVGDTWYQYRRVEPFNTVIASAAIAYDEIKNSDDETTNTQKFGNVAEGITKNLIDSSYLQGVSSMLDRFGRRKGMLDRTLASFVPYSSFWRSINRSAEVMMEGEAKFRDASNLFNAFSQVIPGLSGNAPAKMNVWGEEIVIEGGVLRQWLPYKWSKQTADPLELELEKIGVYPGLPGKFITINRKKVELPDELYKDYAIKLGHTMKVGMDRALSHPVYQKISKTTLNPENAILKKRVYFDNILGSIRNQASRLVKKKYIDWKASGLSYENFISQ